MKPVFRIVVDGEDRTSVIADRLLSLNVTDEDGRKADRVEIDLDNRDGKIAFPETGVHLEVSLGFAGQPLVMMGIYAVDGISGRGPVRSLSITATAADLLGEIRAPQTRSWIDKTLEEIVQTIAAEVGLRAVVSASLRNIRWPFLAQTAESNVHFLARITAEVDAICKPAGGVLLVQKRGEGISAAGDELTPPSLDPTRLSEWSWSYKGRTVYRAAEAEWTDTATGITHKIKSGSGTPIRRLRHAFATEAEATRAVDAALKGAGRAEIELSARLSGFEPGLLGGATVEVTGLEPQLDGEWHLKSVVHRLDAGGLVSEFEAERGKVALAEELHQ